MDAAVARRSRVWSCASTFVEFRLESPGFALSGVYRSVDRACVAPNGCGSLAHDGVGAQPSDTNACWKDLTPVLAERSAGHGRADRRRSSLRKTLSAALGGVNRQNWLTAWGTFLFPRALAPIGSGRVANAGSRGLRPRPAPADSPHDGRAVDGLPHAVCATEMLNKVPMLES